MKLYAESLQGKVDEADRKSRDFERGYKEIVEKLRATNEELKRENSEVRREYEKLLMECRALRERNVSTV